MNKELKRILSQLNAIYKVLEYCPKVDCALISVKDIKYNDRVIDKVIGRIDILTGDLQDLIEVSTDYVLKE